MIELIDNIRDWFIVNRPAIMSVLLWLNTTGITSFAIVKIKQYFKSKRFKKVESVKDEELKQMKAEQELTNKKLDAMLDMFSIVYSTIKNEDIKKLVSNKIAETKSLQVVKDNPIIQKVFKVKEKIKPIITEETTSSVERM